MAYTALYRKFRPQTFDGVIGQEHIVQTLKNQMKTGRASHAYLFCGTRGTGKTSTAKIFARAINCTSLTAEGEPCNECDVCRDILAGRSVNVIEIDAASNNSVENIREIREEVKYPPTQGKFKVYIIDEVHMLSNSAFNALLKTLEEPPAYVIFILATTDPQKVPATILSRCQRFDFRRITTEEITRTLMGYLEEEGHRAQEDAVRYVARLGDGSMRDSLSILDQCLAFFGGEEVTLEKVLEVVGAVDRTVLFEMAEALSRRDAKKAMTLVEEMLLSGRDVKQFAAEFLEHIRNLLVVSALAQPGNVLDLSAEEEEQLKQTAGLFSPEELVALMERFSVLQGELRYAANERILLEVELMKLCAPWTERDVTTLAARLGELERKIAAGIVPAAPADSAPAALEKPAPPKRKPPALPEDMQKIQKEWPLLCSEISYAPLQGKLRDTEIQFKEDGALYIACPSAFVADVLEKGKEEISAMLEKTAGKTFDIRMITKEEYEQWREKTYGRQEDANADDDPEFASLAASYFPDADIIDD